MLSQEGDEAAITTDSVIRLRATLDTGPVPFINHP